MKIDLWKFANGITAFSVAQSIAFSYAAVKTDGRIYLRENPTAAIVAAVFAVLLCIAYCYALARIHSWEKARHEDTENEIWNTTMIWRYAAVIYFTVIQVAMLFSGKIFDRCIT